MAKPSNTPSSRGVSSSAPGRAKASGQSAKSLAPGQMKKQNGGSAKSYAPGQKRGS